MAVFVAALGLILALAWLSGRLRSFTLDDVIAGLVFLLGLSLFVKGSLLPGAAAMAAGMIYAGARRGRFSSKGMPLEDARRLLGVSDDASPDEIRAAHRRLIARAHPDAGGTEELAQRINAARDALIAEAARTSSR